jgi:hypothetical protein
MKCSEHQNFVAAVSKPYYYYYYYYYFYLQTVFRDSFSRTWREKGIFLVTWLNLFCDPTFCGHMQWANRRIGA